MNPKYLPNTTDGKLARLGEEAAEVVLELFKARRFGLDTRYCPKRHRVVNDDPTVELNREAIIRELADLKHAITAAEAVLTTAPLDYTNPFDAKGAT